MEHLERAPIAEAILDWRVEPADGITVDAFAEAASCLADELPRKTVGTRVEGVFEVREGELLPSDPPEAVRYGFLLGSADGKRAAQFRVDGFSAHQLRPYPGWGDLSSAALNWWLLYAELALPKRVVRLAARYINRFTLPSYTEDLEEWLAAPPPIPQDLPQVLSQFLTRVTIHEAETGNAAHVTQTMEHNPDTESVVLILDIEAFRAISAPADSDRIAETLASLRVLKNRIFFESVTPRTLELFR
ncbi:TIGR04255 family protein [Candidatus Palauibacter sp.]|uniref:TIGR04255 family protein n=1 Tax=Candidatus Palauibacter sp. TaxID=3101350 RepID=UPI003AF318A0